MIPEAAVQAALKEWGVGGEVARNIVNMILEAAAPHMLAGAWEAGFGKGAEFERWNGGLDIYKPDFTNPYRSQA